MPMTPGLAQTPMVDKKGYVSQPWQIHFRDQDAAIQAGPVKEHLDQPPVQGANITLAIVGQNLSAGLYRVTGYVRIDTPATTSSSLKVTVAWTDGGQSCFATLIPAVTGNTRISTGTGTMLVRSDAKGLISFNTEYLSVPDLEMKYFVSVVLEKLGGT